MTRGESVLLRPTEPLAAWHRRKQQLVAASVSTQGHRFERLHPKRTGCDCLAINYQAPQIDGLPLPSTSAPDAFEFKSHHAPLFALGTTKYQTDQGKLYVCAIKDRLLQPDCRLLHRFSNENIPGRARCTPPIALALAGGNCRTF